ncbi:MAG: hypothetical protein ACLQIQ_07365 [Beijerinckiaceae bacterium]
MSMSVSVSLRRDYPESRCPLMRPCAGSREDAGRRLDARTLPNRTTEAKIGCIVLNRMTGLAMPVAVRIK